MATYYSPIFYTLSGLCRVGQRSNGKGGSVYLAEIRIGKNDWAIINSAEPLETFGEAARLAVSSDRFAEAA